MGSPQTRGHASRDEYLRSTSEAETIMSATTSAAANPHAL